jgi:hypothetical protein
MCTLRIDIHMAPGFTRKMHPTHANSSRRRDSITSAPADKSLSGQSQRVELAGNYVRNSAEKETAFFLSSRIEPRFEYFAVQSAIFSHSLLLIFFSELLWRTNHQ